jgi:MFS family permease
VSELRTATGQPFDAKRASVLLGIFAGMALMVTYVETMVLPAFGQFESFFYGTPSSADVSTIAWILSAYLLVGTVVVPIFGKLGDLYGKKRMLLVAMGVYAAAVTIAGFTPNLGNAFGVALHDQIYLLIGARAVQGIGMGMFPLAFAMLPETFPAAAVGKAQGVVSAMFGAGAALGLAGGGWIAQTYGWPFTYHTVIPAAILVVLLAALLMKESPKHEAPSVDLPGIASLGVGLATLLVGITEGPTWGWGTFASVHWGALPWGVPEFFLLSAASLLFFVAWEPRARNPVIRFPSLRPRNIWISDLNAIFVGLLMFFTFTTAVILAELPKSLGGLGASEFTFGLVALPAALGILIGGVVFGGLTPRIGPKPIALIGYVLGVIGAVGLLLAHATLLEIALSMVPLVVGNVAGLIAMSNLIVLTVDRRELGVQTGMNQTFRNLGTAIAPVMATSILASYMATYLVRATTPTGASILVPVRSYAAVGFEVLFAMMIVLGVAGFVLSLGLKNFRFLADGTQTGHRERAGTTGEPAPISSAPPLPVREPAAEALVPVES